MLCLLGKQVYDFDVFILNKTDIVLGVETLFGATVCVRKSRLTILEVC